MKHEIPTITVGELRKALAIWDDTDLISFGGLTFYRAKGRGGRLVQIEFKELVYLDESGRVVVQSLE